MWPVSPIAASGKRPPGNPYGFVSVATAGRLPRGTEHRVLLRSHGAACASSTARSSRAREAQLVRDAADARLFGDADQIETAEEALAMLDTLVEARGCRAARPARSASCCARSRASARGRHDRARRNLSSPDSQRSSPRRRRLAAGRELARGERVEDAGWTYDARHTAGVLPSAPATSRIASAIERLRGRRRGGRIDVVERAEAERARAPRAEVLDRHLGAADVAQVVVDVVRAHRAAFAVGVTEVLEELAARADRRASGWSARGGGRRPPSGAACRTCP